MPKFTLTAVSTVTYNIEIEAQSLKDAIDKTNNCETISITENDTTDLTFTHFAIDDGDQQVI